MVRRAFEAKSQGTPRKKLPGPEGQVEDLKPVDWAEVVASLFRVAILHWKIQPSEFWRMSMPEIWCLCEEPKSQKRYGQLTESEVAELYDLLHSQPDMKA